MYTTQNNKSFNWPRRCQSNLDTINEHPSVLQSSRKMSFVAIQHHGCIHHLSKLYGNQIVYTIIRVQRSVKWNVTVMISFDDQIIIIELCNIILCMESVWNLFNFNGMRASVFALWRFDVYIMILSNKSYDNTYVFTTLVGTTNSFPAAGSRYRNYSWI